jgi:hypothetical protein
MGNNNKNSDFTEQEKFELIQMVISLRQKAIRQIQFGLGWWVASAIAMYVAMQSTGGTTYWYGGALGALFHWYRAFKMLSATRAAGFNTLMKNEKLFVGATVAIVLFTSVTIMPEFLRIESPTVGTCWADVYGDMLAPVACWSNNVTAKTIFSTNSPSECPGLYLEPSEGQSQFMCLEEY